MFLGKLGYHVWSGLERKSSKLNHSMRVAFCNVTCKSNSLPSNLATFKLQILFVVNSEQLDPSVPNVVALLFFQSKFRLFFGLKQNSCLS